MPSVRWTGAFAPAYRAPVSWAAKPGAQAGLTIMLYRGSDTAAARTALEGLAGETSEATFPDTVFEIIRFSLSSSVIQQAARIPGVYSIQFVGVDGGPAGEMTDQVSPDNVDENNQASPGYEDWLADVGLTGDGVVIASVDCGVQNDHPDLVSRITSCSGSTCAHLSQSNHGTHTTGIMVADGSSGVLDSFGFLRGLGVAPGASFVEQIYDQTPPFCDNPTEDISLLIAESYNNGASLSNNSWGTSSGPCGYNADTRKVDVGVRDADPNAPGNQPLTYVQAIGNGGGGTSSHVPPAAAKNVFTVGGTKMQQSPGGEQNLDINDLANNTSHGPACDGRKIPHIVAPGKYLDSTKLESTHGLMTGTSMAAPHVSGAIALFIEYYRGLAETFGDPSPAMIKTAFTAVAHDLAGNLDANAGVLGHPFDSKQGWGRLNVAAVVDPSLAVRYFDAPLVFGDTGEQWELTVASDDPTALVQRS